jgi:single-strand DNA-binding protein
MSLNKVILIGRLTRDPEMRTTGSGLAVVNFSLAVDRIRKGPEGEDADFFNCAAFGKTAEFVSQYLHKGRLAAVDGRLQQRKYTTKDGQNREVYEVIADNVQGLDRPRDGQGGGGGGQAGYGGGRPAAAPVPDEDDYDPFAEE